MSRIKEILLLHHSHYDRGFMHPQPVLVELEQRYVQQAIEQCEKTADWPEESRLRWTCEVTAPFLDWERQASAENKERMRKLAREGRIDCGAFRFNNSRLAGYNILRQQIQPVKRLREEYGLPIRTAIQHDVNGVAACLPGVLHDAGIDFLITGSNMLYGHLPTTRPTFFRWRAPDGGEILVMFGEHYGAYQRFMKLQQGSFSDAEKNWAQYEKSIMDWGYPYDWIYLTATIPGAPDNNPVNVPLLHRIRQWNEEGREPRIRLVCPGDLLEKARELDHDDFPILQGDFNDSWSFGLGSIAAEVAAARYANRRLRFLDLAGVASKVVNHRLRGQIINDLEAFAEHTFNVTGSAMFPHLQAVKADFAHKAAEAYRALDLTDLLLRDQMELLAANDGKHDGGDGLLFFNPSNQPRNAVVRALPGWLDPHSPHDASRAHGIVEKQQSYGAQDTILIGPVELPPLSWRIIKREDLPKPEQSPRVGEDIICTPFHELIFNRETGVPLKLVDRQTGWTALEAQGDVTPFSLVVERPHPSFYPESMPFGGREGFLLKIDKLVFESRRTWRPEWIPQYIAARPKSHGVDVEGCFATLKTRYEIEGFANFEVRVRLSTHHPDVEVTLNLVAEQRDAPQALYMTLPTCLDEAWRCWYDCGNVVCEFDDGQLPGLLRDFVCVDEFLSMQDGQNGVSLFCTDAPLLQPGGFNFARCKERIERNKNPLLLAWPMNNYWTTNHPPAQPGHAQLKYTLRTHQRQDPAEIASSAYATLPPVEVHPVASLPEKLSQTVAVVSPKEIIPLQIMRVDDPCGTAFTLSNPCDHEVTAEISVPGQPLTQAHLADAFDNEVEHLQIRDQTTALCKIPARTIQRVIVVH